MSDPAPGFQYSGKARHRLRYDEVKRLARAYGLPGDAIAQIAKGESGMYADVQQRDPGDGMVGYGLLQMTPNAWGKGSAAYQHMQSLGGIEAMKDPNKNMAMARFLYKSAGNKLTPWYGTRFLTNRSGEGKLGPINPNLLSKGASEPAAGSTSPASSTTTTTRDVESFDKAGYEAATKKQVLAQLLSRRHGAQGSVLLRTGAISAAPVDPAQYTTTKQVTDTETTPSSPSVDGVSEDGTGLAAQLKARADTVDSHKLPYKWGGGHGGKTAPSAAVPVDCSGAVSEVLGINPKVASQFKSWGKPGDGGNVTIYAKDTHVLMKINGHFFGTSTTNPGGGAGWIPQGAISPEYLKGFTARHA